MKHIVFLAFVVAIGVGVFGCAADEDQGTDEVASTPEPAPAACPVEWSFAADAASYSFTSDACGVALRDGTLRLRVRRDGRMRTVTARQYPTRDAVETPTGWTWRLAGRDDAPAVTMTIVVDAEAGTATMRGELAAPAGLAGEMGVDWVEVVRASGDEAGVVLPAVVGRANWLQNGYDSWTFTGVERMKDAGGPPDAYNDTVRPCANNYDYLTTCAGFSWWMGAVAGDDRTPGLLWGALAAEHWKTYAAGWYEDGLDRVRVAIVQGTPGDTRVLAAGGRLELEPVWLMAAARPAYDLRHYADAAAAQTPPREPRPSPFGWGTWYGYFAEIDAEIVRENCAALRELYPGESGMVCQIDDGYEARFGDWTTYTPGFPDGVAPLAAEIRGLGQTPGLWMAPLLVDVDSPLVDRHPSWFLRDYRGDPVYFDDVLAFRRFWLLDVSVPGAADYVARSLAEKVADGFEYLKLDFLFGGAYEGARSGRLTSLEAYHRALEIMREAAGEEVFLLASGEPWLPSLGTFHAARTSSDVAGSFPGFPYYPSVANLARSHGARGYAHGVWWANDPDNIVVRPPLTMDQAEIITAMMLVSGSTILGDPLVDLPDKRLDLLTSEATATLRELDGRFWAVDLMDEAVLWPIATPAFDLLMLANAPPQIWVREAGEARVVAIFNWDLLPDALEFDDRDLAMTASDALSVEQIFGADDVRFERQGADRWLAQIPGQRVGVFLIQP